MIYSPDDLSCYWNQAENSAANPAVIKAIKVGQNVVDYATGRELPADKLTVREVKDFGQAAPKRGALRIAKLRHAGDWNVAPLAVPNLMDALARAASELRRGRSTTRSSSPRDPNLVNYPLIYMHGRAAFAFAPRRSPCSAATSSRAAARSSPTPPAAAPPSTPPSASSSPSCSPTTRSCRSPATTRSTPSKVGFDLSNVQYSKAAGGRRDFPQLEGVKLNGHWAVIYSKYDIGCALERHQGLDCKGYSHESALRIAANIVIYSTLP